ncbi:MAG: hypothetical protein Q8Q90_03210 [bacterium]|nr:hypothetical protein [bacterium]
MNKNFLLSLTALAVMTTLGYAAYTNGSITDLSKVINDRLSGITSVGSNYLGAVLSTQSLATSTTKAAGTKEVRAGQGRLTVLHIDSKTLNVDGKAEVFKFKITAQKNKPDVIKYIDFEIKGKGVATSTNEVIFRRLAGNTNQIWSPLKLISQKKIRLFLE